MLVGEWDGKSEAEKWEREREEETVGKGNRENEMPAINPCGGPTGEIIILNIEFIR